MLLFSPFSAGCAAHAPSLSQESDVEGLYFANQVIQNACASLAILNAVFNLSPADVDIGSELENLKEFGVGMNSMDLGELLSNSDKVSALPCGPLLAHRACKQSLSDLCFTPSFARSTTASQNRILSPSIHRCPPRRRRKTPSTSSRTSLPSAPSTSLTACRRALDRTALCRRELGSTELVRSSTSALRRIQTVMSAPPPSPSSPSSGPTDVDCVLTPATLHPLGHHQGPDACPAA